MDHVSTGHAASPATIVVGRAHRLRVAHATGAPPKIVTNTVVSRKNLKIDEDLTGSHAFAVLKTIQSILALHKQFSFFFSFIFVLFLGISEMFKTPVNEKKRSVKIENSATKTPLADGSRSMAEPSVLNTPEETGKSN